MRKFLFILALLSFHFGAAQKIDFLKLGKYRVSYLPDSLKENSGLIFRAEKLYTFNDGANSSEIFEIDQRSGNIKNVLNANLENRDWEAITTDSVHIYIGDFGNNGGMRKNLRIYKIPVRDTLISDPVQTLPYFYPEQKDFTRRPLNHDFDAEAMVFMKGKIHIFTKEWLSKATTHYSINPQTVGNQPAEKLETFETGFMVTDASYFEGKLYLVGYTKKTGVFLSVFNETEPGIFFREKPRKYYLGSAISIGQIEGIAVNGEGVYISGEEFNSPFGKTGPAFYFIPGNKLK